MLLTRTCHARAFPAHTGTLLTGTITGPISRPSDMLPMAGSRVNCWSLLLC
jgi:hypothetical protein